MQVSSGLSNTERMERQIPPPTPLKGGGGVVLPTSKPLRESMPITADFIDACRKAFGITEINASIKAGMNGQPTFWASENGREIGTRFEKVKV